MKQPIIKIEGKCQYEECDKPATHIASGRKTYDHKGGHSEPNFYCEEHAEVVTEERFPEYVVNCPNCGCMFGVN